MSSLRSTFEQERSWELIFFFFLQAALFEFHICPRDYMRSRRNARFLGKKISGLSQCFRWISLLGHLEGGVVLIVILIWYLVAEAWLASVEAQVKDLGFGQNSL